MKKTLVILVALLMSASVALTSCGDDKKTKATGDGFGDFTAPAVTETDEEGNIISTDAEGNEVIDDSGNSSTWTEANDTVYVLYTANVRDEASTKGNKLTVVNFGTALKRIEKNTRWSKITYTNEDGTEGTGYIVNDLITSNSKAAKFIDQKTTTADGQEAPVITKIKADLGTNKKNAIIRVSPLADGYPNSFKIVDTGDFDSDSIISQIPKGTENITLLAVSEDGVWAKVKGMGYAYNKGNPATTATEVTGYTLYSNLEIAGANAGNNSGSAQG